MKTALILVSMAALFLPSTINAFMIDPSQGKPCSGAAADCGGLQHCCGGPPQGKYCAQCCTDSNCPTGFICLPGYNYIFNGPQHSRICQPASIQVPKGPCFRNDMCMSGTCKGGLGFSGDKINLPLGTCA